MNPKPENSETCPSKSCRHPSEEEPSSDIHHLLFPKEAGPVSCAACGSSANSSLALVCDGCGVPVWELPLAPRIAPILLRVGFVLVTGMTGILAIPAGVYFLAVIMFVMLGAAILRNYTVSQRFFLCMAAVVFLSIYTGGMASGIIRDNAAGYVGSIILWDVPWGVFALILALILIGPILTLQARRHYKYILYCLGVFASGCFVGRWCSSHQINPVVCIIFGVLALVAVYALKGFELKLELPTGSMVVFPGLTMLGVFAGMVSFGRMGDSVYHFVNTGFLWSSSWMLISLTLGLLSRIFQAEQASYRLKDIACSYSLFAFTLGLGWLCGNWILGRPLSYWNIVWLTVIFLALLLLDLAVIFGEGLYSKTRRVGIIMEASRPFTMPEKPVKQASDFSDLPVMLREFVRAFTWSAQLFLFHMRANIIRIANGIVYWSQLILDLLLRSLMRAWRRMVAITKALGKVNKEMVIFVAGVWYRLAVSILLPLIALMISARLAMHIADAFLPYIREGGLLKLLPLMFYASGLYLFCVIAVGFLARCHPVNVIAKEAFQSFSYNLPHFLILVLGTSIVLSLFCGITGIGPYRFGYLSMLLSVFVVLLFLWSIQKNRNLNKNKKKQDTVS